MLGVCYYPEHWPSEMWANDAQEMKALGIDYVRIGEFAWSRIEPQMDCFEFDWLDNAIDTLASANLKVILGTPTATPPKWLIKAYPEIIPVDPETGAPRLFGSRRHYDFSSVIYEREALRITEILANRYGEHPAIAGWQTDNELGCHDTTLSVSVSAQTGFQNWCRDRYGSIDALNHAWGNVFWSMEYSDFEDIDCPYGAVTEMNPAHRLAFRRYSSDRLIEFHKNMVSIIRKYSPDRWITHNFIPKEDIGVDAYQLGADLDFASYDNYPLGRSDIFLKDTAPATLERYMRTGHPDLAAFYHDTSRSFAKGDFWVMEQQPGPVNWAPNNPRPEKGMVRLWSLEAFAHGAACISYFRWRQVPYAQEQMHSGLKRPDNSKAAAWREVEQVKQDITHLSLNTISPVKASVAIIIDVHAQWITEIQRQGEGYDFTRVEFAYYTALRRLGIDVDFIAMDMDFDDYQMVIAPCLPVLGDAFIKRVKSSNALFVFGPMAGSKNTEFNIPSTLPPGKLQELIPIKILSLETLRQDCPQPLLWKQKRYDAKVWCEEIDGDLVDQIAFYNDESPAIVRKDNSIYLGTLTDDQFLEDFFSDLCSEKKIPVFDLPDDMRIRRRGDLTFAFNYSSKPAEAPSSASAKFLLGTKMVAPYGVAVWHTDPQI